VFHEVIQGFTAMFWDFIKNNAVFEHIVVIFNKFIQN
jgi:hypothetical protein